MYIQLSGVYRRPGGDHDWHRRGEVGHVDGVATLHRELGGEPRPLTLLLRNYQVHFCRFLTIFYLVSVSVFEENLVVSPKDDV